MKVAILGGGSWGTALATLVDEHKVLLWVRDSGLSEAINANRENKRYLPGVQLCSQIEATISLNTALEDADAIVFAVPCSAMYDVAIAAKPFIRDNALVVTASKGLEGESGRRMSEIIASALCLPENADTERIVALSGPNLAVEVARGIPTASVAASGSMESATRCQELFMRPHFRVYSSTDLIGVELAGAIKNVIAIGAGVSDGIGYGDNSRAALMTRGLAEISRLGCALGASLSTFMGLAGVGDLIATGVSRLSRNYRVGVGLGRGLPLEQVLADIGQVAEGVPTTRAICILADRAGVEMPISHALNRVLFHGLNAHDAISELMLRPPKHEAIV